MFNYFSRLLRWLKRAAFVSSSLVFMGLCIYLFIASGTTELKAKIVGFVFQGVGLLFAGYALYKTETYFEYPTPAKRIMAWLKDFPQFKLKPIVGWGSCTAPPMTGTGYAYSDIPNFDNIEDRVKYLEELVKNLSKQVHSLSQFFEGRIDDVVKQIYEERNIRIAELSRVQAIVFDSAVSGAVLAELGILYFVASCVFLSFPQGLADLLK